MKQGNESLLEVLDERIAAYRFLSGLYMSECQDAYLSKLKTLDFPCEGEGLIERGYGMMRDYLADEHEDMRQELACDFAKVFLGAGIYDGASASPYESVYASEARLLMQEPRDEVYRIFRSEGIEPDSQGEAFLPEDHLSFELEYMAYCGERTIEALSNDDGALAVEYLAKQKEFLLHHLNNWVPLFCEDVRGLSRTGFYRGVVDVTEGFLAEDEAYLAELENMVRLAA